MKTSAQMKKYDGRNSTKDNKKNQYSPEIKLFL
jgi:hypothetical protein